MSVLLVRAVILSIDSASQSGVALSVPACVRNRVRDFETIATGLVRRQSERRAWAKQAAEVARDEELPLIVASERWVRHGLSNPAFESLCESWGKWLGALEEEAPAALVVRVLPDTWRDAVFGRRRERKRDALKIQAQRYAGHALGMPGVHDDIAEALCLRVWAQRADEVHALIAEPKKGRLLRSSKRPR